MAVTRRLYQKQPVLLKSLCIAREFNGLAFMFLFLVAYQLGAFCIVHHMLSFQESYYPSYIGCKAFRVWFATNGER
jgi:hypothetical protein